MARIPLTSGFSVCPEGTYVLTVESAEYKSDFGILNITFKTDKGQTHKESYRFINKDGKTTNEGALNAFSFLAKNLLNDFSAVDVDPDELVGKSVNATITHTKSEPDENGKVKTYAHIGDISPLAASALDLKALLGV